MFSWQHILETALVPNQAIQISVDVTVTLFLNQSSQNVDLFLDLISSTSVQDFSRMKCFTLPWQHILRRALRQNRVLEISDDVTVTSFLNQLQRNFVLFVCNTKRRLCTKFEQNRKNKEGAKHRKWRHCDVISTNSSKTSCM